MIKKGNFTYTSPFGTFSWQYLDWDSKILERAVAKVISFEGRREPRLQGKLVKELTRSFSENEIVYATYRIYASEFVNIHALEQEGFLLVDGHMSLETNITGSTLHEANAIRIAKESDIPNLTKLASSAFSQTRFYNDPLVKKYQADAVYSEWVKNSIKGFMADRVFVWEEGGDIIGFITLKKNGNISLIAVSGAERGKGIGKSLVKAALNQFVSWGLKKSTVETQTTNVAALRTYQGCGYRIVSSHLTFRWASSSS